MSLIARLVTKISRRVKNSTVRQNFIDKSVDKYFTVKYNKGRKKKEELNNG